MPAPPSAWRRWSDKRPRIAHGLRIVGIFAAIYLAMPYMLIPIFRYIDPPFSSLMVRQKLTGVHIRKKWVDIDHMAPNLVRSVILAEDASFCQHWGVDWSEVSCRCKPQKICFYGQGKIMCAKRWKCLSPFT
ncbi:MAG: transglycosylase domain-containing protein [Alphaproteobacteria bacterium]